MTAVEIEPAGDRLALVRGIVARHGATADELIPIMLEVNDRLGHLPADALGEIGRLLKLPESRVHSAATFYSMLTPSPAPAAPRTLRACDGPACWLSGAPSRAALGARLGPDWRVERTSCLGLCDRAPAALMDDAQACGPLKLGDAADPTGDGRAPDYSQPRPGEVRVMLAHAGRVDPDDVDSALAHGAYGALEMALGRTPEWVLETVEASGLTGRGGAGFPTGRKWRFVAQAPRSPKYVICNADESEPLIFKDRVLMGAHPHQLLEGMALAGYAVGAREGFIYIRGEYAVQAERLRRAIEQAEARGWLGERIRGTDFSFRIRVHRGAGAYICGEETALIESLEGKRGEPRVRPPYPPTSGYRGQPTAVNNVETYSAVPVIVANGAAWYRKVGAPAPATPGTKLYMVLGHVNRPGLFEAPFGLTVRQIIDDFGGGLRPGSEFHFALTGGAAGTVVPASLLDVPMDYPSAARGVALGAGACLVCDQRVSPVAFLRELLHFFAAESCGKCTPCRAGTREALECLTRLAGGRGRPGDVARLAALADLLQTASFCGLGQSVAIPMKSALKHFAADFRSAEGGEPA